MIYRSPYPHVPIPDITVSELVVGQAPRFGDKVALIDGHNGERITYAEFHRKVLGGAAGLMELGVRPGDVVGLLSHNQPRYAVAVHAVLAAGATITPISPIMTASEVARQLSTAKASVLICSEAAAALAADAAKAAGLNCILVIGDDGAGSFDLLLSADAKQLPSISDPGAALAALPFSSGTTGTAKGVMLTHRNVVANLRQLQSIWQVDSDDVQIAVLPFFHIYGFTVILNLGLLRGATTVTLPRFEVTQFVETMARHGVTRTFCAPPMLFALAQQPEGAGRDLTMLRQAICGAAPMDVEVAKQAEQVLGCAIRQGYGMTEASPATHGVSEDEIADSPAGSVGRLVPNTEARLVKPGTNEDVEIGSAGELLVRGPQVMAGYLDNPEATAETLTDGWLHTGDLARVDPEGRFWVEDRLKELIKYKGYQVPPAELEALLLTHPQIQDAAVVGAPDAEGGEVPKAFVVTNASLSADDLMSYVAERVAPYKKIRSVEFIDRIPKSATGKILRRALRDQHR
jgi:acyl-CoA synthetase (AMP-forming)/AMP-acid ligase II